MLFDSWQTVHIGTTVCSTHGIKPGVEHASKKTKEKLLNQLSYCRPTTCNSSFLVGVAFGLLYSAVDKSTSRKEKTHTWNWRIQKKMSFYWSIHNGWMWPLHVVFVSLFLNCSHLKKYIGYLVACVYFKESGWLWGTTEQQANESLSHTQLTWLEITLWCLHFWEAQGGFSTVAYVIVGTC